MISTLLINILKFGGIGSLIFTFVLILMSVSGLAAAVRTPEGKFRKNISWKSGFAFTSFLLFLVLLFYFGNLSFANSLNTFPPFLFLWANAFGIFLVVHLYDLFIIDYLIIVKWHPDFLNLPDTEYYNSFKPHVEGFKRGLFFGLLFSLLVSLASLWFIH